jgi:hypothetical protein
MGKEGAEGEFDLGAELEAELAELEIPKKPAYSPEGTIKDLAKFRAANEWALKHGITDVKGEELIAMYEAATAKDDLGAAA